MPKVLNKELTDVQDAFCKEYLNNGFNATQAYLTVKPNVTNRSAGVNASKLLGKYEVQKHLQQLQHKSIATSPNPLPAREEMVQKAFEATEMARELEKPDSMIRGYDYISRVSGHFNDKESDPKQYAEVINNFTNININQGTNSVSDDTDAIDISDDIVKIE
jgi:hypothetical protein